MVGVVGSSPIAPTKFGTQIKHLAATPGAFFLAVRTSKTSAQPGPKAEWIGVADRISMAARPVPRLNLRGGVPRRQSAPLRPSESVTVDQGRKRAIARGGPYGGGQHRQSKFQATARAGLDGLRSHQIPLLKSAGADLARLPARASSPSRRRRERKPSVFARSPAGRMPWSPRRSRAFS